MSWYRERWKKQGSGALGGEVPRGSFLWVGKGAVQRPMWEEIPFRWGPILRTSSFFFSRPLIPGPELPQFLRCRWFSLSEEALFREGKAVLGEQNEALGDPAH